MFRGSKLGVKVNPGASKRPLGGVLGHLGGILEPLGGLLRHLRGVLGHLGGILEPSGGALRRPVGLWGGPNGPDDAAAVLGDQIHLISRASWIQCVLKAVD